MTIRARIKRLTPWPLHYLYRKIYYLPKDFAAACGFLFHATSPRTNFWQRLGLIGHFYLISYKVDCPHTEHELIAISRAILSLGESVSGVIVEAGAFHGGSTAKLSLVCKLANCELAVFDSFEGMPQNSETHGKSIYGREHHFPRGSHAVGLEEVRENVRLYGDLSRCSFHKGWFKDTMALLHDPVAIGCINADLVSSTKDCIRYLYPLISPGGRIFSQDGHFPWIIDVLKDASFWKNEIGVSMPRMDGLGSSKLVSIWK